MRRPVLDRWPMRLQLLGRWLKVPPETFRGKVGEGGYFTPGSNEDDDEGTGDLLPEAAPDGIFGKDAKVWHPQDVGLGGWARHWTWKAQGDESLIYLPIDRWTIVDIDRKPGQALPGAPRGVIAEIRTDRGIQWILPGRHVSALADPQHVAVSALRGAAGARTTSPLHGTPRILRPGPCVARGLPGATTYLWLAKLWEDAGGIATPMHTTPRRTAGCPRSLGGLDSTLALET